MFRITISRKWHNPKIESIVTDREISLSISMEDFVKALKIEIGSVRWVVKQNTFETLLDMAIKNVLLGVQEESAKVMSRRE